MHIIAPTTPFFTIRYTKLEGGLRPGFSETVEVDFKPTEWRYFYDCIRVHVEDQGNLLIPLHGYPVPGNAAIPRQLNFSNCAIGQTVTRRIPLTCTVPIDFDFKVNLVEDHMFFDLHPMAGTIPAKGTTHITVSYTPQTYSTVTMAFEVLLSQFNAKAVRCNVLASATPGALKEAHKLQITAEPEPPIATPEDSAAAASNKPRPPRHPKVPNAAASPRRTLKRGGTKPRELVVNNIKMPANRRGMQWVNTVLNQPAASDSLIAAQLRTTAQPAEGGLVLPRQRVEELFMMELRADDAVAPGLGGLTPSEDETAGLIANRDGPVAVHNVVLGVGDAVKAESLARRVAVVGKGLARTFRHVKGRAALAAAAAAAEAGEGEAAQADIEVTFERRPGDGLRRRGYAVKRFVQAARKVIIRNRAASRIAMLMDALHTGAADKDAGSAAPAAAAAAALASTSDAAGATEGAPADANAGDETLAAPALFVFSDDAVDTFAFPAYEVPSILPVAAARDPVAVSLPQLPPPPPVFGQLVVPRQCDLLGYEPMEPEQYFPLCDDDEVSLKRLSVTELFLNGDGADGADGDGELGSTPRAALLGSTTATALDEVEYPAGHIFSESSNYSTTFAPIKYSEVDIDHWFNPFGLQKAMPSSVIRKSKINTSEAIYDLVGDSVSLELDSCASATMLPADPSLSNFWVPRLTDPYLESVLPSVAPDLLTENPVDEAAGEDDDDDDDDGDDAGLPMITMEDIYKEFAVGAAVGDADNAADGVAAGGGGGSVGQESSRGGRAAPDGLELSTPPSSLYLNLAGKRDSEEGEGGSPAGDDAIRSNVPYNKHGPIQREEREKVLEERLSTRSTSLVADTADRLARLQHAYAGVSGKLHLALDVKDNSGV